MDEYIEKHLIDVLNAINEVESFFADRPKLFQEFQNDMLRQRAVERNIEIMGEAINRILKANPEFQLTNAKAIINTRNRVIHGYDSVTTEFLWSLGGVISPMDGVGPGDLQIESLVRRVAAGGIKEVILALSTTMEGDTTNFYIYRKLEKMGVKLSVIARGISVGDELEYADEVTLGRSIVNRTLFTGTN